MTQLSSEDLERIANRRATAKMGWYIHATVYVLVNLLLFAGSRYALGSGAWSVFPLLGWGIGLAMHGAAVFFLASGGRLRRSLVERERALLQREQERARRP